MPSVVSLFAGIGGFDLGLERAGFTPVWQVELDGFCQRVLQRRWSGVRRDGDVRSVQLADGGRRATRGGVAIAARGSDACDLLVGGFPCQDLSVAGKRAGLAGVRSGLFYEIVRIAKSLRPTWGLFENVPGLLTSHGGRDMAAVLEGLRECWPVVGYRVLDSRYFGVAQRRRRVFLVGGPDEARVAQVLALGPGGDGHPATGGEAGADLAYALAAGTGGSQFGSGRDGQDTFVVNSLSASHGATEDGTGRGTPLVVDTTQSKGNYSNPRPGDPCHPLAEGAHPPLLIAGQCHGSNVGPMGTLKGDGGLTSGVPFVAHALSAEGADASEDGTGRGTPIIPIQYVEQWGRDKRQNGVGIGQEDDPSFTLDASYPHGFAAGASVRRLTPVECERLQGFPDGWTCLCQPLNAYAADPEAAALACTCPDGPRYRALGNAVTVNVIAWIGARLMAQMQA